MISRRTRMISPAKLLLSLDKAGERLVTAIIDFHEDKIFQSMNWKLKEQGKLAICFGSVTIVKSVGIMVLQGIGN